MKTRAIILLFIWCSMVLVSCNCGKSEKHNNTGNEAVESNAGAFQCTDEEKEGITRAIEYYIEGLRQADTTISVKAFAKTATMTWSEDGKLNSVPIQALYDIVKNGQPQPVDYTFKACIAKEVIAITRIEVRFGRYIYTEMFSLAKDGDNWKIISKLYHPHYGEFNE